MIILIVLINTYARSIGALLTQEAAVALATGERTALAACKVRLCQGTFSIGPGTLLSAMVAAEATYDGYTSGGNAIATWGAPLSYPNGGAVINAETTFAYADSTGHIANNITGGWVETSTGDLVFAFNMITPVTLAANGDGFVLQLQDVFGATG